MAVWPHAPYVPSVDYRAEIQAALGDGFPIERELDGAGASHVFVAEELALGRKVVVKMLPKKLQGDVSAERFQREIAVAARLQHPHLVPLLTAGVVESEGLPWFSMPYVEGESLRELILRRGQLPTVTAARLMRELASALAYAHGRGVVHRDIKPENVLLSDGVAMVTDFGVAMAVDSAVSEGAPGIGRRLTGAGATLGTPAYSAPEQIISAGTVDHRADLYSFGCVAYEMLTGSPPFTGRGLRDLLNAQIREIPVPIEHLRFGLPPALSQVIMRCLEKDPANRPDSGAEIVRVIDSITLSSLSDSGEVRTVAPAPLRPVEPRTEALPPAPVSKLPMMLLLLVGAAIATAFLLY